jgi:hypothetical protein
VASVKDDADSTSKLSFLLSGQILATEPDQLGDRKFGDGRTLRQAFVGDIDGVDILVQRKGEWEPLSNCYGPVKVCIKGDYHKVEMRFAVGVLLSPEAAKKVQQETFQKVWNSALRGVLFDEGKGMRPVILNRKTLEIQTKDVGLLLLEEN